MLIYKKCLEVNLNDIVTAFNRGFSDYIIQLQMTEEILTSRFLTLEQNQLEHSFIAYDDNKPIGLMLGGIKDYEGIKTLRCGALCVDPNYRKLGVASKLFELHKEEAINNGCKRLYLEVIQGNDRAINFYKKQGYKILSELEYYSYQNPEIITSINFNEKEISATNLDEVENIHNNKVKNHLNWQNDFDYMKFFSQLVNLKLTIDESTIAVISLLPVGKIFYLWVDEKYRRLGYGKALLRYALDKFNITKLSISFPKYENVIAFLKQIGFSKDPISQYDMVLELV